jgi:hypothetical protein
MAQKIVETTQTSARYGSPRRARFYEAVVVCCFMNLRAPGLVGILCLMAVGCATKSTLSEAQWRAQLARQQAVAREFGRIGYIGYQGPAVGTSGAGVHP